MPILPRGRKVATVKCLYLDNGTLSIKRLYDLGDVLVQSRGTKFLAWAKGKPILSRVRGLRGYTFLVCPEVCWTIDSAGMTEIIRKGKSFLLAKHLKRLEEMGIVQPPEPEEPEPATPAATTPPTQSVTTTAPAGGQGGKK